VSLQSPQALSLHVDSYRTAICLGMIAARSMSLVCSRNRSGRRMTEYQNEGCSRGWMQQLEANVGRQKLDYMPKPAAGVMRMSADDDGNAPKILRKVNLADSNGSLYLREHYQHRVEEMWTAGYHTGTAGGRWRRQHRRELRCRV